MLVRGACFIALIPANCSPSTHTYVVLRLGGWKQCWHQQSRPLRDPVSLISLLGSHLLDLIISKDITPLLTRKPTLLPGTHYLLHQNPYIPDRDLQPRVDEILTQCHCQNIPFNPSIKCSTTETYLIPHATTPLTLLSALSVHCVR